jgi:hypothetical protein
MLRVCDTRAKLDMTDKLRCLRRYPASLVESRENWMKTVFRHLSIAFLVFRPELVCAADASVKSGVPTPIHTYLSWNNDCSPNAGVVRVATKPQHGKLTPSKVAAVARQNRFSTYATVCLGRTMPGFRVVYTSTPGYRGADSFAIEVIYGGRSPIMDVYNVNVE